MNNHQIISPDKKIRSSKDERRVEVQRHLSGGVVVLIGHEGVLLPPRNAYMVAIGMLKALDIEVAEHWHALKLQGDDK